MPLDILIMAIEDSVEQQELKNNEFAQWNRIVAWCIVVSNPYLKKKDKPKSPQEFLPLPFDKKNTKKKVRATISKQDAIAFYKKLDEKDNG